jgi:hypothetical protein
MAARAVAANPCAKRLLQHNLPIADMAAYSITPSLTAAKRKMLDAMRERHPLVFRQLPDGYSWGWEIRVVERANSDAIVDFRWSRDAEYGVSCYVPSGGAHAYGPQNP